jgi:hypothetical protein
MAMETLADEGGIDAPDALAIKALEDLVDIGLAEECAPRSGRRTTRGPFRPTAKGRALAARFS